MRVPIENSEIRDGYARVVLPESNESGWVSLTDVATVPSR